MTIRPFAPSRVDMRASGSIDFLIWDVYTLVMSDLPAPDLSAGYVHDGQVVYALQFDLEAEAGQSRNLIVWLTSDGHSVASWIQPAEPDRHIVTTKVGEHIKVRDKLEKVIGVSIYWASELPPATMSE